MFRWNRLFRQFFASPQSVHKASVAELTVARTKMRPARPSVKPSLEGLEDRLVPSVSTSSLPVVAEAPAPLVSTMNQLLVTLENDLSRIEQAIIQNIAQEMAVVQQQWDHLLGIDTNSANPSTNSVVAQPASSSVNSGGSSGSNLGLIANQNGGGTVSDSGRISRTKPRDAADTSVQPLTGSGTDTDGNGNINGGISGNAPGTVLFNNGVISGGPGGSGATFSGAGGYIYDGKNGTFGGNSTGSGTLGDGTTFSVGGTYTGTVNGNTVTGTYQATGTNSEDDPVQINGTYSGTVDQNGNITGGTFTFTITVNEPAPNNDTLVWNPQNGSTDASLEQNWYDQTQGIQGVEPPGPNNPVIFDGTPTSQTPNDNSPITWNDPKEPKWTLEDNYADLVTINPGDTIELTGPTGTSLTMDSTSTLYLAFASATSKFQIDSNATITNMQLGGNSGGQFIIAGGNTNITPTAGLTESLGVQFTIGQSAKVTYVGGQNTLELTQDNLKILVNGSLSLEFGTTPGRTLIDGGATYKNDYIDVNGGVLNYLGRATSIDTLTVPITVENGGKFAVTVDTNETRDFSGKLIVQNGNASTHNASVYVADSSSKVTLDSSDTLECDSDYYQANGALQTVDTSTCTLQDGANSGGIPTIAGGSVNINESSDSGYGKLNVNASQLNFNGQLVVAMDASKPNQQGNCDWLNVTGITNLQNNATLNVVVQNGPPQPNQGPWIIIQDGAGKPIQGNFVMPITTSPQTNLTAKVDPGNNTRYRLDS